MPEYDRGRTLEGSGEEYIKNEENTLSNEEDAEGNEEEYIRNEENALSNEEDAGGTRESARECLVC